MEKWIWNLESMEGEYENPDKILKPSGQWNETTAASNYEIIDSYQQTTSTGLKMLI